MVDRRVYRGCVVSIGSRETLVNIIELDMVEFGVILGIDWFHLCYASLECRTRKVMFNFSNYPIIE